MLRIAIAGGAGRMGQALIQAVSAQQGAQLAWVTALPGSACLGQDVGLSAGLGALGVCFSDDLAQGLDHFDLLIDFTSPESSMQHLAICQAAGKAVVMGTTGLSAEQREQLRQAGQQIPVVYEANMSLGLNLLLSLVKQVAERLNEGYDVEIIEAHHRHKVDAPSGTALRLGEAAAEGLGRDLYEVAVYGREGNEGPRKDSTIGFATIRAADVVGEHAVWFATEGERLELHHKASSRMTFAKGAVRAALWLVEKQPGFYDMRDVLSLPK